MKNERIITSFYAELGFKDGNCLTPIYSFRKITPTRIITYMENPQQSIVYGSTLDCLHALGKIKLHNCDNPFKGTNKLLKFQGSSYKEIKSNMQRILNK